MAVTARCQQFINRIRAKQKIALLPNEGSADKETQEISRDKMNNLDIPPLTPKDLREAELFWVRHVQLHHFPEELTALAKGGVLSPRSKLLKLNPFLDEHNVLRLGGRLRHALMEPDEKNPVILPKQSTLAQLLCLDIHKKTLHGGTQLVLSTVRRKYWILNGRTLIKSLIAKCLVCWKQAPRSAVQLMGDLPPARVVPSRPFLNAGVDFAGPINLLLTRRRGAKSQKGYIVVFICFSTRAMHLEVSSDYSAQEFIAVYKRFTGRRGICATLHSDCGTNFVGADRELRSLFQQATTSSEEIVQALLRDGTEWRFNPPGAPHFGGLWEAGVKSVKFHLKRIIGEQLLTFEELTTLLIQIEACLNSRPLLPLTDDPSDLSMLTPAHFLVGEPLTTIPEPSVSTIPANRLSHWQLIRKLYEDFWKRWSTEYLQRLQERPKWRTPKTEVKIGDVCRLRFDSQPPCKWPLARVMAVHPGADGHVRVVTLKTATSTLKRPVAKICPLPFMINHSSLADEGGRNNVGD